jgi:hybrid cluster-associated redox disulfide protein
MKKPINIITRKTLISALMDEHPEVQEILLEYGLHCTNCAFSEFDTLSDGALMHGLDDEDMDLMIRDVNEIVGKKK